MKRFTLLFVAVVASVLVILFRGAPQRASQSRGSGSAAMPSEQPWPLQDSVAEARTVVTGVPSAGAGRAEALRYVTFFAPDLAEQAGLSAHELAALQEVCARAQARLMGQIAARARYEQPNEREHVLTVSLPPADQQSLESAFYADLQAQLGDAAAQRIMAAKSLAAAISASLLHFGGRPLALTFEGNQGDLRASDRVHWMKVVSSDSAGALVLSGELSREGFRAVYGEVAERLLGRPAR